MIPPSNAAHNLHSPQLNMPRISERLHALNDIDAAIESAAYSLVLSPLMRSECDVLIENHIRNLIAL